jgi:hypothetical protein
MISTPILAQDQYEAQLTRLQAELQNAGMQINPNSTNPFITGSALQNYFLNERILLLERDAYFMMKSNKLETTEQVADFQHRLKVLSNHANNILLNMVRSLKNAKEEGFGRVEEPKHRLHWEELLKECRQDSDCINRRISSGDFILQNDLIDSFELSLQIFRQVPYMHALEFASIYQLVQLLQMEVLVGQSRVSNVEFDLFIKKQKIALTQIESNRLMTDLEKDYHRTMVINTINKWKKRILERKVDRKDDFEKNAKLMLSENQKILSDLEIQRKKYPQIVTPQEFCPRGRWGNNERKRCELRASLEKALQDLKNDNKRFLNTTERKLPAQFWNKI